MSEQTSGILSGSLLTSILSLSTPKLAYCVVQFLEKDATLTEHVSTSAGRGGPTPAGLTPFCLNSRR